VSRAEVPSAAELDAAFLAVVADWAAGGVGCDDARFDELARAACAHQLARNAPYARFAAGAGIAADRLPTNWRDVPAVPASAYKDATLATFDVATAQAEFHSSGTTAGVSGVHWLENVALYDAALLAGFDRFVIADGARLRYLHLVPDPRTRPHSSLGYMMARVAALRGIGEPGWYLGDDAIDVAGFEAALTAACRAGAPVCIAGTAFALVALVDALDAAGRSQSAPPGSRLMETGGFKARSRVVERSELYGRLSASLGIPETEIIAEYGMTELVSQYYDAPDLRGAVATRPKVSPPWLRTLVVDSYGHEVPDGEVGTLRHVDLGNRSSCIAINTEDRGYRTPHGIVLLGRMLDAPPRGCSLDAEDLLARVSSR